MCARKLKRKIKVKNGEAVEEMADAESIDSESKESSNESSENEKTAVAADSIEGEVVSEQADSEDNKLVELEKASKDNHDKYLRSVAELENIKKRNAKERRELIMYAGEGLARDVLEVLDSIELALKQEQKGSLDEFVKGLEIIQNQFKGILSNHSIKSESLLGKSFDPNKAEAIAMVPDDKLEAGSIIEEFKKAYFFKDKLLRPAQVVVSKKAEAGKEEAGKSEAEKGEADKDKEADSEE